MGNIFVLRGPINEESILRALKQIQARQPVLQLGMHLFQDSWFYHRFEDFQDRISLKFLYGDRAVFEDELELFMNENYTPNPEKLLWRALVVSDIEENRHHVCVWTFHSISDGYSRMKLCNDLLTELEMIQSTPKSEQGRSRQRRKLTAPSLYDRLHKSTEWRLLPLWKRLMPDIIAGFIRTITFSTKGTLPIEETALDKDRRSHALFLASPEGVMDTFYISCKKKNVSVTAGLLAIYLGQLRDMFNLPSGFNMKMFIPINLRERIAQKMSEDSELYGCGIHTPFIEVQISGEGFAGIWNMAKNIQHNYLAPERIRSGIIEAERFCLGTVALVKLLGPQLQKKATQSPDQRALIGFSNAGNFSGARHVGQFSVDSLGSCMPTGPVTGFPTLFCTTFDGIGYLSLTFCSPLMSKARGKELLEGIVQKMQALSTPTS